MCRVERANERALRIYFQFLPHEDVKVEEKKIRLSLKKFCAGDPFFREHPVKWKSLIDPPLYGHEVAKNHPWTQCLIHSAALTLGREPVVTAAPYPCDASLLTTSRNSYPGFWAVWGWSAQ